MTTPIPDGKRPHYFSLQALYMEEGVPHSVNFAERAILAVKKAQREGHIKVDFTSYKGWGEVFDEAFKRTMIRGVAAGGAGAVFKRDPEVESLADFYFKLESYATIEDLQSWIKDHEKDPVMGILVKALEESSRKLGKEIDGYRELFTNPRAILGLYLEDGSLFIETLIDRLSCLKEGEKLDFSSEELKKVSRGAQDDSENLENFLDHYYLALANKFLDPLQNPKSAKEVLDAFERVTDLRLEEALARQISFSGYKVASEIRADLLKVFIQPILLDHSRDEGRRFDIAMCLSLHDERTFDSRELMEFFEKNFKGFGFNEERREELLKLLMRAPLERYISWDRFEEIFGRFSESEFSLVIDNWVDLAKEFNSIGSLLKGCPSMNEEVRLKIARELVGHPSFYNYWDDYKIADPKIAEGLIRGAAQSYCQFSRNVGKLKISDQAFLLELAFMQCGRYEPLSRFVPNYHLVSEKDRFELAKRALQENPKDFFGNFSFYQISNPDYLNQIRDLALARDYEAFWENRKDFGICKFNDEFTCALDVIKKYFWAIAREKSFLEKCSELQRFRLVISALNGDSRKFSYCFEAFQIANPGYLKTIQEFAFEKIPDEFVNNFEIYQVVDPAEKKRYLTRLVKISPFDFISHIQKTALSWSFFSEKEKFEIAVLLLDQASGLVGENIRLFGLSKLEDRVFLAGEIARLDPKGFVKFKDFEIPDPRLRWVCACQMAEACPVEFSKHVEQFEIVEEADRIKLAKMALNALALNPQSGFELLRFAISDPKIQFDLTLQLVSTDLETSYYENVSYDPSLVGYFSAFSAGQQEILLMTNQFYRMHAGKPVELRMFDITEAVFAKPWLSYCPQLIESFNKLKEKIRSLPDADRLFYETLYVNKLIVSFYILMGTDPSTFKDELDKVIKEVSDYRDVKLSTDLAIVFCQLRDTGQLFEYFDICRLAKSSPLDTIKLLPMLFIQKIRPKTDPAKKEWEGTIESLRKFMEGQKPIFKNGTKPDFSIFLNFLNELSKTDKLTIEEKKRFFDRALEGYAGKGTKSSVLNEINKCFGITAFLCKEGRLPPRILDPSKPLIETLKKELYLLFMDSFKELPGFALEDTPETQENLLALIESTRMPHGFVVYLESIQLVDDKRLANLYALFVQSVVNGSFKNERYKTEGQPHLEALSKFPEIFEGWKKSSKKPLDSMPVATSGGGGGAAAGLIAAEAAEAAAKSIDERIHLPTYLQTRVREGHLKSKAGAPLAQFEAFVEASAEEQRRLIFAKTKAQCEKAKSDLDSGKIDDKIYEPARLELACMELFYSNLSEAQESLKEIQALLRKYFPDLEFCNDIQGLLTALETKTGKLSDLTIEDSDDWQDLFLCGTEIGGSCQRIDGNPNLNKCLMAYCMDGKNRILAVKDPSGKIVARSIIRLLLGSDNTPALFIERVYPDGSLYKKELLNAAKDKARSLGVHLYEVGGGKRLISLSSRAPYEYEDACAGTTDGSYCVNAKEIPL